MNDTRARATTATARTRLEALLADAPTTVAISDPLATSDLDAAPESVELVASTPIRPFGRRQLRVIVAIIALGVVAAGWCVLSARAVPLGDSTPLPAIGPFTGAESAAPTSPAARVLVHVTGCVQRPGVVELPGSARVRDALAAAGGLCAQAAMGDLNLAAPVPDGSQLVIGDRAHPRGELRTSEVAVSPVGGGGADRSGGTPWSSTGSASGAKVDLNAATAAQLDALPGVGPVMAQRIVDWRQQHGRFARVEQLQEVDGVGPKTYERLASAVRV